MVNTMVIKVEDLVFEDNAKLPAAVVRGAPWDKIFAAIPAGKHVKLSKDQVSDSSVRSALKRAQKNGKFLDYKVMQRGDNIFIVHELVAKTTSPKTAST